MAALFLTVPGDLMTTLADFSRLAQGQTVIEAKNILPDTDSPGVTATALFAYQSYFDTTLLERALLTQSVNEPIVNTTLRHEQIGGYALALHPSSQCPVAVQPMIGGQPASAQTTILRPGQVFRPHGRPSVGAGNFSSFRWGLPFGWLGGGIATLYVLPSSDASVTWAGETPEIIFHRQTMKILAPGGLAAQANARKNWPLRFPWTQALRGTVPTAQGGPAAIGIGNPTRVIMSLQLASLGAAATMRVLFQSSNDFDLNALGAIVATPVRFVDTVWGSYAANGGGGNLGAEYPLMELSGEIVRLAADDGGIQLVDMSASTLTNAYVDVVRYGKL